MADGQDYNLSLKKFKLLHDIEQGNIYYANYGQGKM